MLGSPPRWKSSFFNQRLANGDGIGVIHRENSDRRPTDGSLAYQQCAFPGEVSLPLVLSGVKQPSDAPGLRVDSGDVRSLMSVVVKARESQIVKGCFTPRVVAR
jgi:hypothetical protein